jgi:hypothetical protein
MTWFIEGMMNGSSVATLLTELALLRRNDASNPSCRFDEFSIYTAYDLLPDLSLSPSQPQ